MPCWLVILAVVKVGAFQHTVFMFKRPCRWPEVLSAPIGSCGNAPLGLPWELEALFKTKYRKAMLPPASVSVNTRMDQGDHHSVTTYPPNLF